MLTRQFLLPDFHHLPGFPVGKVAFQASLFRAVPSFNAAPQSGDLLSGNRGEGTAQNKEFVKVDKCQEVGSGSYVIPGQRLTG